MRRIVRGQIVAALGRQQADLERFISRHLEVGDAFPLILAETAAAIRETRGIKVVPRFGGDFPDVDVTAALRVAVTAIAERRETARGVRTAAVPEAYLGRRTFAIDVELRAVGAAAGNGYELRPMQARLTGWWGFQVDRPVTPIS